MRHDPGLHEGPVCGINWKWREAGKVFHSRPLRTDDLLAKQQRAAKRVTAGPGDLRRARRHQPRASLRGMPRWTRRLRRTSSAVTKCFRSTTSVSPSRRAGHGPCSARRAITNNRLVSNAAQRMLSGLPSGAGRGGCAPPVPRLCALACRRWVRWIADGVFDALRVAVDQLSAGLDDPHIGVVPAPGGQVRIEYPEVSIPRPPTTLGAIDSTTTSCVGR